MSEPGRHALGAIPLPTGATTFSVWAPARDTVDVRLLAGSAGDRPDRSVRLEPDDRGYHRATVEDAPPGTRYLYVLDGELERPDPASRYQPETVHGPSAVVSPAFDWSDHGWRGLPLEELVFYELHVGTFSDEGTFDGVIPHLRRLREELGVTTIELMPVAQFPGARNWGYDGVLPYAVQNSYGGPDGLRRLVDAAHAAGLAVTLDVVYNHMGPEGNYLRDFGPYFTSSYRTPWGDALNFDDAGSDEVRRYFIDNALHWFDEYHIDALRLDAVHAIFDRSAYPFLTELADETRTLSEQLGRPLHLIAESDLNDPRLIRPRDQGGFGLSGQWADDFHHAVHARLTGERDGYYADYGGVEPIARALELGYTFTGQYSAFRQRSHGALPADVPPERFVVAIQNHDQVGNRMMGERLGHLIDFEALKVAAAANLLSPFLPLLWMGEEYDEAAPFLYFVSHGDEALVQAVREGRRREFEAFTWAGEPPDPQAEATFRSAKLDHTLRGQGRHAALYALYAELLRLRREMPELRARREITVQGDVLLLRRKKADDESLLVLAMGAPPKSSGDAGSARDRHRDRDRDRQFPEPRPGIRIPPGTWDVVFDTAADRWAGPGAELPQELEGPSELNLAPTQAVLLRRR